MNMHLPALPRADTPRKQLAVIILKVLFCLVVVALVAASIEQQIQQRDLEKAQHAAQRALASSAKAQASSASAQQALSDGQLAISQFAHLICTNQFEAFSAVDSLIDHGIQVTQQRLAADIAAGRTRNVAIDRRSIASSKVLRAKFAPLDC